MFVHRKQDLSLSLFADDIKMAEKKQNMVAMWKNLMKNVDIDETTSVLGHIHLGCTQRECKPMKRLLNRIRICLSHVFLLEQQKITGVVEFYTQTVAWRHGGHAQNCVERYCELANKKVEQLYKSSASLFGWSSMTTGGTGISWRIVRSLFASCLEMLLFGTNWTTWHLVVSEQVCKDQSQTGFGHVTND